MYIRIPGDLYKTSRSLRARFYFFQRHVFYFTLSHSSLNITLSVAHSFSYTSPVSAVKSTRLKRTEAPIYSYLNSNHFLQNSPAEAVCFKFHCSISFVPNFLYIVCFRCLRRFSSTKRVEICIRIEFDFLLKVYAKKIGYRGITPYRSISFAISLINKFSNCFEENSFTSFYNVITLFDQKRINFRSF